MALTEDEIRPDRLKLALLEAFHNDIRRLMARKDEFVTVSCPACSDSDSRPEFEKYGLNYQACAQCATVYVSPRPSPAILADYYANSENYRYWNKYVFPASEQARRTKIFAPRARRLADICQRHQVQTRTFLEVGAGFGTFCEEVGRLNLFQQIRAVEPTPDLAETCRRKGIDVIDKPIEQVSLPDASIDVIASFEVIEHLFNPRSFLLDCSKLLCKGGLLVLSCPNGLGFETMALGQAADTFDVEHLNYFNPASLSELLKACGLEVLETMTPGELDAELVRKKVLAGEARLDNRFLRKILVDDWEKLGLPFQRFLADNNLSSHMWIVARKG